MEAGLPLGRKGWEREFDMGITGKYIYG